MKKIILFILLFPAGIFLQASHAQRSVDVNGTTVSVPDTVRRIADAWPAHNMVIYMLGYGDRIVATSVGKRMCPWFYKINPAMEKAVACFAPAGEHSMEELLNARPDIVFLTRAHADADAIRRFGFTVIELSFSDFEGLRKCVLTTGEVLGGEAITKAEKYVAYLDRNVQKIQQTVAGIPQNEKPKVLHITSLSPITVSGKGMIMDAWIRLCGGVNAAADIVTGKQVSPEQILLWDPDIIIYAGASVEIKAEDVMANPALKNTKAGKNGRIYINPKGLFSWDRYSAEEALQIQWAAQKFYPERFRDFDAVAETISFYDTFFHYPLTRRDAERIMSGLPPEK
jgi:iron complex transport system substrate-binding protein